MNMQLKAASAVINKDRKKALKMIESATHLSSEALIDVRNSVFALHQESIDIKPLSERLKIIADSSSSKTQEVKLSILGEPREVPPRVELTLYRAGQEMINNAMKHSNASQVSLTLDYSEDKSIVLTSVDNGVGSSAVEPGFGLLGIDERVKLLNGKIEIKTSQGEGFMIRIHIPSQYGD